MVIDPGLTSLEIMGLAIKSEVAAADVYDRLAQRVRNQGLREKLLFLKSEEEKHRAMLEEMYAKSFPEVELVLPPRSLLPKVDIALSESTPVPELLEIAMEWEKLSEEFYADFAKRAEDARGRVVLRHLSKVESSHYHLLKAERDFISQFPDYYKVEEFHFGEDMVHFGP
jgi:rubrerythrin